MTRPIDEASANGRFKTWILDPYQIFSSMDKSQILQELRIFSDPTTNLKKCFALLKNILFLSFRGLGEDDSYSLTKEEATRVFFAVTKTYQCKDPNLRHLTLVSLKTLASLSDNVIIIISSLVQDISSNSSIILKGCAVRTLGHVLDVNSLFIS